MKRDEMQTVRSVTLIGAMPASPTLYVLQFTPKPWEEIESLAFPGFEPQVGAFDFVG